MSTLYFGFFAVCVLLLTEQVANSQNDAPCPLIGSTLDSPHQMAFFVDRDNSEVAIIANRDKKQLDVYPLNGTASPSLVLGTSRTGPVFGVSVLYQCRRGSFGVPLAMNAIPPIGFFFTSVDEFVVLYIPYNLSVTSGFSASSVVVADRNSGVFDNRHITTPLLAPLSSPTVDKTNRGKMFFFLANDYRHCILRLRTAGPSLTLENQVNYTGSRLEVATAVGECGTSGADDGAATSAAKLRYPCGIATSHIYTGVPQLPVTVAMFLTENFDDKIRRVYPILVDGDVSAAAVVTISVGYIDSPRALLILSIAPGSANLLVGGYGDRSVWIIRNTYTETSIRSLISFSDVRPTGLLQLPNGSAVIGTDTDTEKSLMMACCVEGLQLTSLSTMSPSTTRFSKSLSETRSPSSTKVSFSASFPMTDSVTHTQHSTISSLETLTLSLHISATNQMSSTGSESLLTSTLSFGQTDTAELSSSLKSFSLTESTLVTYSETYFLSLSLSPSRSRVWSVTGGETVTQHDSTSITEYFTFTLTTSASVLCTESPVSTVSSTQTMLPPGPSTSLQNTLQSGFSVAAAAFVLLGAPPVLAAAIPRLIGPLVLIAGTFQEVRDIVDLPIYTPINLSERGDLTDVNYDEEIAFFVGVCIMSQGLVLAMLLLQLVAAAGAMFQCFHRMSWLQSLSVVGFPSLLIGPMLLAIQPSSFAASTLLKLTATTMVATTVIAVVTLVLCVGEILAVGFVLVGASLGARLEPGQLDNFVPDEQQVFHQKCYLVALLFEGKGQWVSTEPESYFADRYWQWFAAYGSGCKETIVIEMIVSLLCGVIQGIQVGSRDDSRSFYLLIYLAVIVVVYSPIIYLFMPFRSKFFNYFFLQVAVMQWIVLLLLLSSTLGGTEWTIEAAKFLCFFGATIICIVSVAKALFYFVLITARENLRDEQQELLTVADQQPPAEVQHTVERRREVGVLEAPFVPPLTTRSDRDLLTKLLEWAMTSPQIDPQLVALLARHSQLGDHQRTEEVEIEILESILLLSRELISATETTAIVPMAPWVKECLEALQARVELRRELLLPGYDEEQEIDGDSTNDGAVNNSSADAHNDLNLKGGAVVVDASQDDLQLLVCVAGWLTSLPSKLLAQSTIALDVHLLIADCRDHKGNELPRSCAPQVRDLLADELLLAAPKSVVSALEIVAGRVENRPLLPQPSIIDDVLL